MALKECKECGGAVSSKATTCPHCGVKTKSGLADLIAILVLLVAILAVLVFMVGKDDQKVTLSAKHEAIIKLLKSDAEPSVKDALWASSVHLRVGVLDDGNRRDGFADYICQVLRDHGIKDVRVTVNDIVKITRDNDWVTLGKSKCR